MYRTLDGLLVEKYERIFSPNWQWESQNCPRWRSVSHPQLQMQLHVSRTLKSRHLAWNPQAAEKVDDEAHKRCRDNSRHSYHQLSESNRADTLPSAGYVIPLLHSSCHRSSMSLQRRETCSGSFGQLRASLRFYLIIHQNSYSWWRTAELLH
jgi:hypothetical protein